MSITRLIEDAWSQECIAHSLTCQEKGKKFSIDVRQKTRKFEASSVRELQRILS